jgi:glycosyltransferase involved in cell wall biosynthesis
MKIAQVAPLYESVPPKLYGGTERIVSYLTEELIKQGHDVTLFASGDSVTKARLIPAVKKSLRLQNEFVDSVAHHIVLIQEVIERANEFDIIHFHIDYLHYPFSQLISTPHLTTLHGRLDLPDLQNVYNKFSKQPVVSISNDQRRSLPQANWIGTVYHGIPVDLFNSGEGKGNYLAFLGRISPEKGLEKAIEWSKASQTKLKIAAKVDDADKKYFEEKIKHFLDDPLVEFLGEVNEEQKRSFLCNGSALVFPIDWNEPFGIVMIEAMACGTPVIAYSKGSVPEVIDEGMSGFIVKNTQEAVDIIHKISDFPREKVRRVFEKRFIVERMTKDYVELYKQLCENKKLQSKPIGSTVAIHVEEEISSKIVV